MLFDSSIGKIILTGTAMRGKEQEWKKKKFMKVTIDQAKYSQLKLVNVRSHRMRPNSMVHTRVIGTVRGTYPLPDGGEGIERIQERIPHRHQTHRTGISLS